MIPAPAALGLGGTGDPPVQGLAVPSGLLELGQRALFPWLPHPRFAIPVIPEISFIIYSPRNAPDPSAMLSQGTDQTPGGRIPPTWLKLAAQFKSFPKDHREELLAHVRALLGYPAQPGSAQMLL